MIVAFAFSYEQGVCRRDAGELFFAIVFENRGLCMEEITYEK